MSEVGIEAPSASRAGLHSVASNTRQLLGCTDPYLPVVEILELGISYIAPGFTYDYVPSKVLHEQGVEALTCLQSKTIFIPDETYDDALDDNGRARFTIAHEIAHAILHGDIASRLPRTSKEIPPYKDPEWQANYFAGAFLAPAAVVNLCRDAYHLMSECGISLECARVRILQLKQQGLLREDFSMRGI